MDASYEETVINTVYDIVYSYSKLYSRVFLPTSIHIYTYRLVREGVIQDYWRDWIWTGLGPYSYRLDEMLTMLLKQGLLIETCIDNLCGLLKLGDVKEYPRKIFVAVI